MRTVNCSNGARSVAALAVIWFGTALPAAASQADIDLLQSYVGNWSGRGETVYSQTGKGETVACKMTINTANVPSKLNYRGKCAIAGGVVNMNGTVAYVEQANHYEAVMTSNTPFKGTAIGKRSGNSLSLNLRDTTDTGEAYDISSSLTLKGDNIIVDFLVTNVATGDTISASVPFNK